LAGVTLIVVATATAATAAEAFPPTAASATAPRSIGLWFGFVDFQSSTSEAGSIQRGDRFIGFTGIGHFDKSKAASPAGFPVGDDADALDCAVRLEESAKFWFSCTVGQVADVQVLHKVLFLDLRTVEVGKFDGAVLPEGSSPVDGAHAFSFVLVCSAGATSFCSAKVFNMVLVLWRRLIFCLRRRLNLALSPLIPDILISCRSYSVTATTVTRDGNPRCQSANPPRFTKLF
jgi:hypothetical protein